MDDVDLPDSLCDEMRASWHRYLDLVTPIRPALYAYCRRLTRSVWDAEDLVQESLLRAFGTLSLHHGSVRNPRGYLLRIATNTWVDTLRRRQTEANALAQHQAPESEATDARIEVRDAGERLLHRLAPKERAAVILKDVFDVSLEEAAEVLETTVGAVKAALHRGRERLREPEGEAASRRPLPARSTVERFVALYNAEDKQGLLELLLDNAVVENIGVGVGSGYEAHRSEHSWFDGALGGHPEWPTEWRFESQRAERAHYEGEDIVLVYRTRRGREKLEIIVRLEEDGANVSRLRSYGFCPETTREVGEALGVAVRTGPYRYPTKAPGVSY